MFAVTLTMSTFYADWLSTISSWLWVNGLLAILFSIAVARLARLRGWLFVARLAPALAVALLLMFFALAESRGEFTLPIASRLAQRQPVYSPFCEDYWWIFNTLCWSAQ